MFYKNTAQDLYFGLVNITTGSGLTGATPVGFRTIENAAYSLGGSIYEVASGQYWYSGVAADFNADEVGFCFTATNGVPIYYSAKCWDKTVATTGTVTTDSASREASKADVSALATYAQLVDASGGLNTTIGNLNNFDPTTTPVAVSGTVTTDSASREASKADVSALATYAQLVDASGGLNTAIEAIETGGESTYDSAYDIYISGQIASYLPTISGQVASLESESTYDSGYDTYISGVLASYLPSLSGSVSSLQGVTVTPLTVGEAPTVNVERYVGEQLEWSITASESQTGDDHELIMYAMGQPSSVKARLTTASGNFTIDGTSIAVSGGDSHTSIPGAWFYQLWNVTNDETICDGTITVKPGAQPS